VRVVARFKILARKKSGEESTPEGLQRLAWGLSTTVKGGAQVDLEMALGTVLRNQGGSVLARGRRCAKKQEYEGADCNKGIRKMTGLKAHF